MYKFYFNDCLPLNCSEQQIISCLNDTLSEYQMLKTKYNNDIEGVISSKHANEIILNNIAQFSLQDSINALSREMKRYAFAVFTKYPIESYSEISDEDDLIKDVTPDREVEIKVYELRIFKPVAYRIYLAIVNNSVAISK
ncbi:hypothetical protein EZS27_033874 [termite gut metagenome]|uniref:Uncharacterized protein n=1 Tax=termite gut metagenome TaxID=433724 RepID=A0A5J4Q3V5_9ZZZZ